MPTTPVNEINLKLVHKFEGSASCSGINPLAPQVQASLYRRQRASGEWVFGVEFVVSNAKLHARARFPDSAYLEEQTQSGAPEPTWGLWDYDVCEVFISSAQDPELVKSAPYFEFQVSPFGQYFELRILEPRTSYDEKFRAGVKVEAAIKSVRSWTGSIEVPLDDLGCSWDAPVYGGVFSCLLTEPRRAFLAAHGQEQDTPDFHRPDLFFCLSERPLSLPARNQIQ